MEDCCFCGAKSDGVEGWWEDHKTVCISVPRPCPSRQYGCLAKMRSFEIGVHLRTACPAAVSPCRLLVPFPNSLSESPGALRCNSDSGPVYLAFDAKNSQLCSVSLRRLDLDQHYIHAHPDFGFLNQPCPYFLSEISSQRPDNSASVEKLQFCLAAPASPLYPPPEISERKSRALATVIIGTNERTTQSDKNAISGNDSKHVDCEFRQNHLQAIFPSTALHVSKSATKATLEQLNITALEIVIENVDLMPRILDHLGSTSLQTLACVSRSCRAACDDPMFEAKMKMVSFRWSQRDGSTTKPAKWESLILWEKPKISPCVLGWEFKLCTPWRHYDCCPWRKGCRSLDDLLFAARRLGRLQVS